MKKNFLILFVLLIGQIANATVYQVDNNSTQPGILTSIDSAIALANNGDTILITPSPTSYGDVYVTKQLTFIGDGYYNPVFGISEVDNIYIRESNVVITGLEYFQTFFEAHNAPGLTISNILIERCSMGSAPTFIGRQGAGPGYIIQDVVIRNCLMEHFFWIGIGGSPNQNNRIEFDSLTFENNIISTGHFGNWGSNITGATTVIFKNNLFIGGVYQTGTYGTGLFGNQYFGSNLHDVIFFNNIFYNSNPQGCNSCTFYNNLTYQNPNDTLYPIHPSNIISDPLFVNYPGGSFNFSHDYHLQQTPVPSPCIGAGVGGSDIGIYGGLYPFNVGEGPKIPIVDFVNISKSATPLNGTFYLQFDARTRK